MINPILRHASSITNQIIHSPHLKSRFSTVPKTTAEPKTSTLRKTAKVFWVATKLTALGGILGSTGFGLLGAKAGYLEGKKIVSKAAADGNPLSPEDAELTIRTSMRQGASKGFDEGILKGLYPITLAIGTWNRLNK